MRRGICPGGGCFQAQQHFAVLNGHYHGGHQRTAQYDDDGDGTAERPVYLICTDYQADPQGGSQYIKFLYF